MSVEAMAVVLHHSKARGTDKLVLLGIANHAGDGGSFPKVETLAKYANVTERAVQQSVAKLIRTGELLVDRNAGGTHRTRRDARPNLYTLLVQCPINCDRSTQHRLQAYPVAAEQLTFTTGPQPVDDGANSASPRGHGVNGASPRGVKPASPEPSVEPSPVGTVSRSVTDPRARGRTAVELARIVTTDARRGYCLWPAELVAQ